jgi:STE20-related kinase adapter protein alpha
MVGKIIACRDTIPAYVQVARHKNTNRNVAIKRYSIDKLPLSEGGEDSAKYIQHEVASMKLFLHPNLLHCLAAFVVNQEVWIVTPLMSFGSVKDLLSTHFHEGLPELACCFILRDILQGLQYLHFQARPLNLPLLS